MKRVVVALMAAMWLAGCAGAPPKTPAIAVAQTTSPAPAATQPTVTRPTASVPPVTLAANIDAYIGQPQFARADWGIAVHSLDSGKVLYRHNADRLFVPASNAKLFTAALALACLGNATRITTSLYATSTHISSKGVLRGDLILFGHGDPSLGLKDVSPDWAGRLAAALAARGVKRVHGNLIADATYFSGQPFGGGREADDLQTWYGAAPSALSVEGNLVKVQVSRTSHRCCGISVTPNAAGVHIVNLTSGATDDPLSLYRPVGSSTLYATGQLLSRSRSRTYSLSMPDPARTAGNLLREAMANQGITLSGNLQVLHWPRSDLELTQPGTQAIASIDSPSIAELVEHMLKHSDNLYAQALLLQVGALAAEQNECDLPHPPDTSAGWGLCALHRLLAEAGIPSSAVRLAEGSGLSRRDLVTPNAAVQWLTWAVTQPWGPDLRNALPVAGVDGTLEQRFRDGAASDNLQAKTGTLNHAYTLTGFVTDAAGDDLVFSLMLNRYPRWGVADEYPDAPSPEQALDAIAKMLAQYGAG
ncbi:MAG TPA: D-alanyl-D-alanine carboxypeptidase/D-alanyl-D-alanine-endopeptidase [Rhodanobacteraceae bacterium]|nr:D-alanyl-D-alanine carboxypeptidase/D-alanyl-D-alanine-endopeptidase [Rhodanobacteraceae bacterium]